MTKKETEAFIDAAAGRIPCDLVLKNAKVINVFTNEIVETDIGITDGRIVGLGAYEGQKEEDLGGKYVAPGFLDAHLHIESTMVTPTELGKAILASGTTTLIADPHEIVNVFGAPAMEFLLANADLVPVNLYYMQPSCVPCTEFETAGAVYTAAEMEPFWDNPHVLGLGEVMSVPAVLYKDPSMLDKIAAATAHGKHIDGHAPVLSGKDLQAYVGAGVENDHESSTFESAKEKLRAGQYILVREGSAAKNLHAIVSGMVKEGIPSDRFLFCTDDKHLSDIYQGGHIRHNIELAIAEGVAPVAAYKMASYNAAVAYGLVRSGIGAVAPGYLADLVVISDLEKVTVEKVYKKGVPSEELVVEKENIPEDFLHSVHLGKIDESAILVPANGEETDVIGMISGQIVTEHLREVLPSENGVFVPNKEYNKLVVCERHGKNGNVAACALKGYQINGGAVATTVAHDSHNIIAAGDNDKDLLLAIKTLQEIDGGYVLVANGKVEGTLPLPLAGLMSIRPGEEVTAGIQGIEQKARTMGIPEGIDPFISLSFMALPVIPSLRLTDKGLFDGDTFSLITN